MLKKTFLLLAGLAIAAGTANASENLDGKALFKANCAMCHGADGSVSNYGKKLKPYPARNLRAVAHVVDRDELRRIITYGVHGTAMTPKKYILDALQIEAVLDYIESFTYKPDLAAGKRRYQQVCAQCHGMDGRSQTGVGGVNLVYSKLDLKGIVHTMRYGRPGTMMPAQRHQLSNVDINNIAHYVYSLRYKANVSNGRNLYKANCQRCHRTPRDIRLIGNAATTHRTISDLSDRLLDLRIRHGRHIDRAGPQLKKLSADNIQDIIAYMRTQTK